MSDAEATIRHALLNGMAQRKVSSAEEAVDAILETMFATSVRSSVIAYLTELNLKEIDEKREKEELN